VLGVDVRWCIVGGAALIVGYTLVGGFWAASVTDFVQGALMLIVALVLPAAALAAAGGLGPLVEAVAATTGAGAGWLGGREGAAALAFVAGTMGIGLAAPGQPHVVNHFMATRDDHSIRRGGAIAIAWIALVLAGMLVVGWSGRLLAAPPARAEEVLYTAAAAWLPAVLGGFVTVAVMSAIMSTVDSQLLTATSSVTIDWRGGDRQARLHAPRVTLLLFSVLAAGIALYAPASVYSRVLFAWNALGAAFGPLVVLRVLGGRPLPGRALASMWAGFLLTVLFYLLPDSEGDLLERVVPFLAALAVAALPWRGRAP
jgi:Na+/proline symporter